MFRRRSHRGDPPPDQFSQYGPAAQWWDRSRAEIESDRKQTSWLSGSMMLQMSVGYAYNSSNAIGPEVYFFIARVGAALRMTLPDGTPPMAFAAAETYESAVAELDQLPRDSDLGILQSGLSDEDEALLLPIVQLVSETAEDTAQFTSILSVDPALWNAEVALATDHLRTNLRGQGVIRRASDLALDVVESFLRYGFCLRAFDEALSLEPLS
jgi:hypothetical protein